MRIQPAPAPPPHGAFALLALLLIGALIGCGGGGGARGTEPAIPAFPLFQRASGNAFADRIVEDLFFLPEVCRPGMAPVAVAPGSLAVQAGRLEVANDALHLFAGDRPLLTLTIESPDVLAPLEGLVPHAGGILANESLRLRMSCDGFVLLDPLVPLRLRLSGPALDLAHFELGALSAVVGDDGFYASPAWMLTDSAAHEFLTTYGTYDPRTWRRDYSDETRLAADGERLWSVPTPLEDPAWQIVYDLPALRPFFFGLEGPAPRDETAFRRRFVQTMITQTRDGLDETQLDTVLANLKINARTLLCPQADALPPDMDLIGMINWPGNYVGETFAGPYLLHDRERMAQVIETAHAAGIRVIAYIYVELPESLDNDALLENLMDFLHVTPEVSFDGFYMDGHFSGNYLRSRQFMLQLRNDPRFGPDRFVYSHSSSQGFYKVVEIRQPFDNLCDGGLAWENFGVLSDELLRLNFGSGLIYDLLPEAPRTLPDGTPLSTEAQFPMAIRNGCRFRPNGVLERPSRNRHPFPMDAWQAAWTAALGTEK